MILNSNDISLYVGGVELQTQTAVTIDFNRSNVVVTQSPSNGYIQRIPGVSDHSIQFEGYLDFDVNLISDDPTVRWAMISSEVEIIGEGIVSDVNRTGGTDEAPTYSGSITGYGEITFRAPGELVVLCDELGLPLCDETGTILCARI